MLGARVELGEVGEEARMIPVRETGDDMRVEIGQYTLERFRLLRRPLPECAPHLTGFDGREDGELSHTAPVIDRPFGGAPERRAQRFGAPVRGRRVRAGVLARRIRPLRMVRHANS